MHYPLTTWMGEIHPIQEVDMECSIDIGTGKIEVNITVAVAVDLGKRTAAVLVFRQQLSEHLYHPYAKIAANALSEA